MFRIVLLLIVSAALIGCGSKENTKLIITGSSTVAPLATEIAKRYEEQHPNTRIDVQTGGSSRGINDARKELADIGMASRSLKAEETDLTAHTVALDGIGIILHTDNPINELSQQQIVDIYTGTINNWQDVGGKDQQIVVVNKAEGRSTLELFLKYFKLDNSAIKADIIIGDNQQGLKTVVGNPLAISYVSIGAASFEADNGAPIKLLPMEGVEATLDNVKNRSFPLSRQLNFITVGDNSELAQSFLDFALSKDVHDLVENQFFIPLDADER